MFQEGELSIGVSDNQLFTFTGITASPFNWLEATYYYVNIKDVYWGTQLGYLDKGFNVKLKLVDGNQYKFLPNISVGLNDLAGTGLFSSEYIVATQDYNFMNLTLGFGYGALANKTTISNPFSFIGDRFKNRQSSSIENIYDVGSLSYQEWFTGDASIFGGIELYAPYIKGLKFIIETNNYDFNSSGCAGGCLDKESRITKSDFNFGFHYSINDNFSLLVSMVNEDQLTVAFRLGINISQKNSENINDIQQKVPKKNHTDKLSFYRSIKDSLNNNKLYLQEATLHNKHLDVTIAQAKYTNMVRSAEEAAKIILESSNNFEKQIESFGITNTTNGLGINKIMFTKEDLNNEIRIPDITTIFEKADTNKIYNGEYQPRVLYPVISHTLSPQGMHHIGSPERFYYGGLALKISSSMLFSRRLSLSSDISLTLYDEFDEKINKPDSALPHVRSEVVRYLQEGNEYISRLQFNYIDEIFPDYYARISTGIFESMFAGIGMELLHSPFDKNYSVGFNLYSLKQRDYNQLFDFLEYKTSTGHLNFYYTEPRSKITAHISYGRYLAKDDGYTVDFSRRFQNGGTIGAFFTITDVPRELFGEGSFDKGFYFQIPISIFTKDDRPGSFSWAMRPLTRDGGQKVEDTSNLYGIIYGSKYYQIKDFSNSLNNE